jgi:Formin Homology 2 Domain
VNKTLNEDGFKKALELILHMGNYLNYGTFRGAARGFELDALSIVPCDINFIIASDDKVNR